MPSSVNLTLKGNAVVLLCAGLGLRRREQLPLRLPRAPQGYDGRVAAERGEGFSWEEVLFGGVEATGQLPATLCRRS